MSSILLPFVLLIACALSICSLSEGQESQKDTESGNYFLPMCSKMLDVWNAPKAQYTKEEQVEFLHCHAFIDGVTATLYIWKAAMQKDKAPVCIPQGVTSEQTDRIVVKYLKDHPEELHQPFGILVFNSLSAAFPCIK
jgi:hypothetical protein